MLIGCASSGFGSRSLLDRGGGAPWTIRCLELQGSNRLAQAEQVADTLRRTPGVRSEDVYILDEADSYARVYYGAYHRRFDRRINKAEHSPQMRADLAFLRELGDPSGQRFFLQALPVRKPQPDVGRPEWNLSNVAAAYSLQVAAFEPNDEFWEFKQAAADYCEFLRAKGYDAFYHHGISTSVVTVGRFGPEGVIRDAMGRTIYSQDVQTLQQEELLRYNLVNGGVVKVRADNGQMVPVPSRLVEVPRSPRTR